MQMSWLENHLPAIILQVVFMLMKTVSWDTQLFVQGVK